MRLTKMEQYIKDMLEEDPDNPKIYDRIYVLCKCFFMRNKLLNTEEDSDIVANLMATDMYMKRLEIHSWCGYISYYYHDYIRIWKRDYQPKIFDCTGTRSYLEEPIVQMSYGSAIDNPDISNICMRSVIEGIPRMIDRALDASTYYPDTKEYLNARISLMLSVANSRFISFNQTEEDENYTRMLYRILMDEIISELYSEEDKSFNVIKNFALESFKDQVEPLGGI